VEVACEIGGQLVGGLVAPRPVLFQAAHHNPVEIAADEVEEPGRLGAAVMGGGGERLAPSVLRRVEGLGGSTSRCGGGFRRDLPAAVPWSQTECAP